MVGISSKWLIAFDCNQEQLVVTKCFLNAEMNMVLVEKPNVRSTNRIIVSKWLKTIIIDYDMPHEIPTRSLLEFQF